MRILVIDNVNYTDYPTGGIMSFYRSLLPAFGNDLILAGIATDGIGSVGKWEKRMILGTFFDYYTMAKLKPSSKRPLIPERITNCVHVKRHINRIIKRKDFDVILTQSPEVVFFIPESELKRTCFIMPGVSNPLSISRYPLAKYFSFLYDHLFLMPKAAKVKWLLAAADKKAREVFSERSSGRIKAEHIIQFPTRYDDNFYSYCDQLKCRNKLNIPTDVLLITTVGRLGWYKGWKLMLDSFVTFSDTHPNSLFVFVGDGEDENKILSYLDERNIKNKVLLVGKKRPDEIGLYLNASNMFVMGSYTEGWSTTLLEACACCIPCVVTDFSSAREMVENGVNGFVLDDRDVSSFAEHMEKALSLKREDIVGFNKRLRKYAVSNLKDALLSILN